MLAVASSQTVTHLDAAVPFLASLGLVVIGVGVNKMVERRITSIYEAWSFDSDGRKRGGIPVEFSPKAIGLMAGFIVDAGQAFSLIVAPGVAFFLLGSKGLGSLAVVFYLVAFAIGVLCLAYFITAEHPEAYARHTIARVVTPMALGGIFLNAVCAVLLLTLGP